MSDSSPNPRFGLVRSADEISRWCDRGRGNAVRAAGSGPVFRERSKDPSGTMARDAFAMNHCYIGLISSFQRTPFGFPPESMSTFTGIPGTNLLASRVTYLVANRSAFVTLLCSVLCSRFVPEKSLSANQPRPRSESDSCQFVVGSLFVMFVFFMASAMCAK
jgi:hypothetical protein